MKLSSAFSALAIVLAPFAVVAPKTSFAGPRVAVAAAPAAATPSAAAATPRVFELTTSRVHLRDLGITLGGTPDVDLGPTPPLGSTRTIDRDEIARALTAASAAVPAKLPAQVRVVRKARKLAAAEVDRLVRGAIDPTRLPRGATITTVRAGALEVPDGFERVSVELPAAPRRAGAVTVTAAVTFLTEGDVVARSSVSVELAVPAEALIPDVAKGASIQLVVKRGLVEVSIGAVAGADGDVNGVVPILLKPSGRMVRARIVDKDHAVALEDS